MRAFDNFWDADGPHSDLQDHYESMWVAVVERFKDHPAVLGYDLINEPFPGSSFDLAEALTRSTPPDGGMSRTFDEEVFGPFYRRMIDAIRAVDSDGWIFVESRYGAIGNGSPCFIPRLEDPRPNGPRIGYAPHLYSTAAEAQQRYGDDDGTVEAWERERRVDMERMQAPIWLGEFGTAWGWEGTPEFIEDVVDMADRMAIGWSYWSWDASGPDGWSPWDRSTGEDNPMAKAIARPYPRRFLGAEPVWSFDQSERRLVIELGANDAVDREVEIFVAAASWYPEGWSITFEPALGSDPSVWDADREVLDVVVPSSAGAVTIVIAPE